MSIFSTEAGVRNKFAASLASIGLAVSVSGCGGGATAAAKAAPTVDHVHAPQRSATALSATHHYGPLVVKPGYFEGDSAVTPWSSWWYPNNDDLLFNGPNSPLQKYDRYNLAAHGKASKATDYERIHIYSRESESWEGLCNAWSAAALLEAEPKAARNVHGVDFSIGDQKALLLKSYEHLDGTTQYGTRYNGPEDDFADIYPDQFLRVVMAEMVDRQRGLIIDRDPGQAVWNEPIYMAFGTIAPDAKDAHLLHVDMFVSWPANWEDLDRVGTEQINQEYWFDLYGDARADGSYEIQYGEWTGKSVQEHPDFVTVLPDSSPIEHHSRNPEIDNSVIKEILSQQ